MYYAADAVVNEIVDTDEPVVTKELHDVDVEVAPPMDGLSKSDDPFTPREGKTLIWKDINMTLVSQTASSRSSGHSSKLNALLTTTVLLTALSQASGKAGEPEKKLLSDVWGEVPAHKTTAIMGPSGAGKTSLLNILAGRARSNGNLTITSDVRLNNYTVDPTNIHVRKLIAFVAQDDSLQVTATPREVCFQEILLRNGTAFFHEPPHLMTTLLIHFFFRPFTFLPSCAFRGLPAKNNSTS